MRNVFVILSVVLFFNGLTYAFAENAPSSSVPVSTPTTTVPLPTLAPTLTPTAQQPSAHFVYEQLLNMQGQLQKLENQLSNKALLTN